MRVELQFTQQRSAKVNKKRTTRKEAIEGRHQRTDGYVSATTRATINSQTAQRQEVIEIRSTAAVGASDVKSTILAIRPGAPCMRLYIK